MHSWDMMPPRNSLEAQLLPPSCRQKIVARLAAFDRELKMVCNGGVAVWLTAESFETLAKVDALWVDVREENARGEGQLAGVLSMPLSVLRAVAKSPADARREFVKPLRVKDLQTKSVFGADDDGVLEAASLLGGFSVYAIKGLAWRYEDLAGVVGLHSLQKRSLP